MPLWCDSQKYQKMSALRSRNKASTQPNDQPSPKKAEISDDKPQSPRGLCGFLHALVVNRSRIIQGTLTVRELGRELPHPGRFVLYLLQVLSSDLPVGLKSICLLVFSVFLPLKLQRNLNASWVVIFIPLYVFAVVYCVELVVFLMLWSYHQCFEEIQKADKSTEIRSLILWRNDQNIASFTPEFGQFSYALGNTHSTDWLKKLSFAKVLSKYNAFVKSTQVFSGIITCFLFPVVLQYDLGLGWRMILFSLLSWYFLFLLWV
jgi:hypothetical protein